MFELQNNENSLVLMLQLTTNTMHNIQLMDRKSKNEQMRPY